MNPLIKIAFGLFVLSLPASYWTPIPAVLCFFLVPCTMYWQMVEAEAENLKSQTKVLVSSAMKLSERVEELETKVNALSIRSGLGSLGGLVKK